MRGGWGMSSEWPLVSIDNIKAPRSGSIAIGPFGSRMKSDCYVSSGVRVVRGTNLTGGRSFSGNFVFITPEKAEELNSANLLPNDLVFPHRGVIGEVGIVPNDGERYVLSSSMMKLTCAADGVHPDFIYYFFKSEAGRFELLKNASQVGTPGIGQPLSSLKQIKLKLPPVDEQRSIAAALRALDDRIALLRETNATLEAIAQALFKSWFVDFDPVRAKQQGLAPAGVDEATAALFPDSFEDSSFGAVPTGWRAGTLGALAELNSRSWSARSHPERIKYLDLANAKNNEIAAVPDLDFDAAPSRARRVLRSGDTIVGTVRPGNRSFAFIRNAVPGLTASTGFAVLSPKAPANSAFVYLTATQDASIEHLARVANGGAYPAVRPDVVAGLACVVPPIDILRAFNAVACPMLEGIGANQCLIETLATLRDALLPRLISGRLRLPAD